VGEERDDGICAGSAPPIVRGILTDVGMTLAEAAAALERGERLPLSDVQRRMVEAWAVEHAQ
jgi:hypothetical protein